METIEQYLARGGKIQHIEYGHSAYKPEFLKNCRCGCKGEWTDHRMRAGENGRQSIVIGDKEQ